MIEKITFYYTNDIHSHFEYWPRIAAFLKKKKLEEAAFLFDIGDHIDRFHPYTDGTLGKGNVRLMNDAGYDAATIGNNEGITLPHEALLHLYDEANFDVILANLYHENGELAHFAKPYKLYETAGGLKVGVIGVTVNFKYFYEPLRWMVTDPFEALDYWLPIVEKEADIIVVLSHLGLSDDERIANEYPQVHLVLGGHTHHVLQEGKLINNCLLCCTGKHGLRVGKAEIFANSITKQVIDLKAELIDCEELPIAEDEHEFMNHLEEKGKSLLSEQVAKLPYRLESDWFQETDLIKLLSSSLTEWCEADCSFLNAGILIDGLNKGIVTKYDIHSICPHPINPCLITLSGAKLKEVLVQTSKDEYSALELKGFGFRGKVFGKIVYDNIEIKGKGSSIHIKVGGEAIDPDRIYKVATIDMFAFARFYPELTRSEKKFYLPEFIRELLERKLKEKFPISNFNG